MVELPIFEFKTQIIELIQQNEFSIITGETGSGKSTQISQYIVDGLTNQSVVITQPRRVAAIQMAQRVSFERNSTIGAEVGYTVRFDDCSSHKTRIKYVTDGILVRECVSDSLLSKYTVVILDEAHERSLNTDILFALCKIAVQRRKGSLRMIVTSATLRTDQISNYYNKCPVISVSGRCYPVSILHKESGKEKRVENSVGASIRIHLNEPAGDILVFLTGFEECEKASRICFEKLRELAESGKEVPPMMIATLYGAQSPEQQKNAFVKTPEGCRKIIFATNIAETSLTVDNVGYVIDCGFVKQKQFNSETGMESLLVVPISKVQAVQRAGRAGRTREGKCIRLYTEEFYNQQLPNATLPEIKRVNLTSTILTLKQMNIDDVLEFDFLDRPDPLQVEQALKQLYLLDAIDKDGKIMSLGQELAKFPIEPMFAKSLLAARFLSKDAASDCAKLLSILSTESIWMGISKTDDQRQKQLSQAKKSFSDNRSDHQTLVNIFDNWQNQMKKSIQKTQGWSFYNCLQHRALLTAKSIFEQLQDLVREVDLNRIERYFDQKDFKLSRQKQLRYCLSQGFFMNTCRKVNDGKDGPQYITVNEGTLIKLDRDSSLSESQADYIVFTQLNGFGVEGVGSIRLGSEIEVDWVRDLIPRLQKSIDVKRLSGQKQQQKIQQNPVTVDQLHEETKSVVPSKEDKVAQLKERYLKRQKLN